MRNELRLYGKWRLVAIFLILMLSACIKSKVNENIDIGSVLPKTNSSIRLFNTLTMSVREIVINNIPISGSTTAIGKSIFPGGTWGPGTSFTIPTTLIDKSGNVHLIIGGNLNSLVSIDTVLHNDVSNPVDLYLVSSATPISTVFKIKFLVVKRTVTTTNRADHFKIRIINLGDSTDQGVFGMGNGDDVSLTYADGTLVDPTVTGIKRNQVSSYTELPYGAYQFKLFKNYTLGFTKQITEAPLAPYFDPDLKQIIDLQEGSFPPIRTFKPGGIYSLIVYKQLFTYTTSDPNQNNITLALNAYQLITDNGAPVNLTYASVQGANALTDGSLRFTCDGNAFGDTIRSGKASSYKILVQGTHHIEVFDSTGRSLVQKDLTLYPYDNYTGWVYLNKGKPDLIFTNTDVSSSRYITQVPNDDPNNGSLHVAQYKYVWQTRFLNLSNDLPLCTFTNDYVSFVYITVGLTVVDSLSSNAASINMAQGYIPLRDPYVIIPASGYGFNEYGVTLSPLSPTPPGRNGIPIAIRVYASPDGLSGAIPGKPVTGVGALYPSDFITNRSIYSNGVYPLTENGIYSVALIGNVNSTTYPDRGRLMYIKHNK